MCTLSAGDAPQRVSSPHKEGGCPSHTHTNTHAHTAAPLSYHEKSPMIGKTVEANLPKEFLESNRSDIINSNKSEKNRGYIEKSPCTCNEELHYIEISNHEMLPFPVTGSESNRTPLGCGRTRDSQHESAPEKSAVIT